MYYSVTFVFAKSSSKVSSNIEYKYEWREGERGRSGEGKGGREMGKRKGERTVL